MTAEIILHHYWRSSCSWRVRWAFHHKGVAYEGRAVNLLQNEQNSEAFLAINPGGYVPALQIAEGVFGESLAMLEWIEERWPQNPLLPRSPEDRMRVRQMCHQVVSGTQPLQNLSVLRKYSSDSAEQAQWARHWIAAGLEKLEALVKVHGRSYCFGGALSMADLCLVPQIYNANRFQVDVAAYPNLKRIHDHLVKLPSCIAAAPENQPGATPV